MSLKDESKCRMKNLNDPTPALADSEVSVITTTITTTLVDDLGTRKDMSVVKNLEVAVEITKEGADEEDEAPPVFIWGGEPRAPLIGNVAGNKKDAAKKKDASTKSPKPSAKVPQSLDINSETEDTKAPKDSEKKKKATKT